MSTPLVENVCTEYKSIRWRTARPWHSVKTKVVASTKRNSISVARHPEAETDAHKV